jgi:hypothetical protein
MTWPPSEAGGSANAAHQKLNCEAILLGPLAKINSSPQVVWQLEAQRLLREYWRTGNRKHIQAFVKHFAAMRLHWTRYAQ